MSTSQPILRLKSGRERAVLRRHPWIFSGALEGTIKHLEDGELVTICSADSKPLAVGYTSNEGSIAVKILSFGGGELSDSYWSELFQRSFLLRERLQLGVSSGDQTGEATTGYRVVNAEGDGAPGLICDRYGDTYVLQFQTRGVAREEQRIVAALLATAPGKVARIVRKMPTGKGAKGDSGDKVGDKAGDKLATCIHGEPGEAVFLENGLKFIADWEKGQKTGFFLDQRDNRALLRRYAHGARVLNTFCYTGGFSIAALAGGASKVVSIDASQQALSVLEENLKLNGFGCESGGAVSGGLHQTLKEDVLRYVGETPRGFDVVVLDPPAFVKHRDALRSGLKGYRKVNRFGFDQLSSGGLLFTFSCSQAVTTEMFRSEVFEAACEAGRSAQVLHELHQAPCHPISLHHPEGDYLKGLVVRVS